MIIIIIILISLLILINVTTHDIYGAGSPEIFAEVLGLVDIKDFKKGFAFDDDNYISNAQIHIGEYKGPVRARYFVAPKKSNIDNTIIKKYQDMEYEVINSIKKIYADLKTYNKQDTIYIEPNDLMVIIPENLRGSRLNSKYRYSVDNTHLFKMGFKPYDESDIKALISRLTQM